MLDKALNMSLNFWRGEFSHTLPPILLIERMYLMKATKNLKIRKW